MDLNQFLRKTWHFIWHEDSFASWIVNIILAFILIKFIVYPGLGFLLGTSYPIVAVVSGSMEHNANFNTWFDQNKDFYTNIDISKDSFKDFNFRNGFNTGDIMILRGREFNEIEKGDVIVFRGSRSDPIIHRVIIRNDDNTIQTKGDNNAGSNFDEKHIKEQQILGRAWLRIPLLGYVKIVFVNFISIFQ